jgi:hypothetical protein
LEAVASVFGDSKNLEDFEKRLNDPDSQISNLDLNNDNEVDYLRVVEAAEQDTHVVVVQAVIAPDQYQDVASIEVEKDSGGETRVQVVGDVYMYGPNYIIEPVYVRPPVVFSFFWGPYYRPYRSPYYWGYYPRYYRPWRPYPVHTYRRNVHVHVNVNHTYRHTTVRHSHNSVNIHNEIKRNDYGKQNPNQSFAARNAGVSNRAALERQRKTGAGDLARPMSGPEVGSGRKTGSKATGMNNQVSRQKVSGKSTGVKKQTKTKKAVTKPGTAKKTKSKTKPKSKTKQKSKTKAKSKTKGKAKTKKK